jgi:integrase
MSQATLDLSHQSLKAKHPELTFCRCSHCRAPIWLAFALDKRYLRKFCGGRKCTAERARLSYYMRRYGHPPPTRYCLECNKVLTGCQHAYCGRTCAKRAQKVYDYQRRHKDKKPITCAVETCRRIFIPHTRANGITKYCSEACAIIGSKQIRAAERRRNGAPEGRSGHHIGLGTQRFLSPAEQTALIKACRTDPPLRVLVKFFLYTGCHWRELAALKVKDFDRRRSLLTTDRTHLRVVVLDDPAFRFVEGLCRGQSPDTPMVTKAPGTPYGRTENYTNLALIWSLQAACKRAEIPPTSFKGLRYTHGANLVARGWPIGAIAQQLGHSDLDIVIKMYGGLAARLRR